MQKIKVIHVIPDAPNYELYRNSPRPEINWDLKSGQWVGIWGTDWPDLLVMEMLKVSDEFELEVWQPDPRADKVYSHKFSSGFIHRLIPAESYKHYLGLKRRTRVKSPLMISMLKEEGKSKNSIVHLHGNLIEIILDIVENDDMPKILVSFHGDIDLPPNEIFRFRKNFPAVINYLINWLRVKKSIKNISYLTYMNETNLKTLEMFYKGEKEKLSMGCDFNFWTPKDKMTARKELNLPADKIIFLSSSRLTEAKQVDKLIKIFTDFKDKDNFYLVFTAHGSKDYENYLKSVSKDLIDRGLLRFTGYVDIETLLKYYSAADVFTITSITEGAPVAVMKAFACQLPIFSTDVGHSAGLLRDYNVGRLVKRGDYHQWKVEIEKILNGEKLKVLDREIAREFYDWPSVAQKFLCIYKKILNKT
jgi:glycosyltransferase involved in cell wall biosynthesis